MIFWIRIFLFFTVAFSLEAAPKTLAEKVKSLQKAPSSSSYKERELEEVNAHLSRCKARLQELYRDAQTLWEKGGEEQCKGVHFEISQCRTELQEVQKQWQNICTQIPRESYGLWYHPETTLGELVLHYGLQDSIYLMEPEVAHIKMSVYSQFPIPFEAWDDVLQILLDEKGVGITSLSPFVKRLYLQEKETRGVEAFVTEREQLIRLTPSQCVCFAFSSENVHVQPFFNLLQSFVHPSHTQMRILGQKLYLVGKVHAIQELLKIYDFMLQQQGEQEVQVLSLHKLKALELLPILHRHYLGGGAEPVAFEKGLHLQNLQIFPLTARGEALLFCGHPSEVQRIQLFVTNLEEQVQGPKERVIEWYTCKHVAAEDLAATLRQVYPLLRGEGSASQKESNVSDSNPLELQVHVPDIDLRMQESSKDTGPLQEAFIVDAKSGALVMVLEQELVPQIKRLIRKVDVPKKMVQLDVLLVERRFIDKNRMGLNLLKLGEGASQKEAKGVGWSLSSAQEERQSRGILNFTFDRARRGKRAPAFDVAYQFLLSQEDMHINANPSLLTMNQTPASIDLMDEISVNTGAYESPSKAGDIFIKDSYERRQYGIHIEMTPIVHQGESSDDEKRSITLKTQINFDTQGSNENSRPDYFRRQIKNEVRIGDGETVIIGGLRQKNTQDQKEKVPFLGEVPGFGKLFGSTSMTDLSTEMFIFITPTIIEDPYEELAALRKRELMRRPGDLPELLERLDQSRQKERQRLFRAGLTMLLGR